MRKIQLTQVTKAAVQFGVVTGLTIDTWLLLGNTTGLTNTPASWYFLGPLAAWGIVGIPASLASTEKLFDTLHKRPGRITAFAADGTGLLRDIPFNKNGKPGTLFANAVTWAIGDTHTNQDAVDPVNDNRVVCWRVPAEGEDVVITEAALTRFLQLAQRRKKYQFLRNYWTKTRRPPMPRQYYEAVIQLLTSAGLIAGRQHGASGYLPPNVKPHNAVTFLKFESQYRL
jgi:hypothetical protein